MNVERRASSVSAERGISNKPAPLPLKNEPLPKNILPLTSIEPVNSEPLCADSTLNPNWGETEAVTLPLEIRNTSSDNAERGILNNPLPSP